jgi:hypothetical protein
MSASTGEEQFYNAIQEKAMAAVKDTLRSQLYPVQYPSQGDFKWNWQNGNQVFNNDTYQYINARVLPGDVPGTVALSPGGGFANAYDTVLSHMVYSLSHADLARLTSAQSNASAQADTIVSDYQNMYGEITDDQLTTAGVHTKQDYVIGYVLSTLWSGHTPPLTYTDMAAARNLRDNLPKAPAGGDQVITDVAAYLYLMQPVLGLQDQQQNAAWVLRTLRANTQGPTATNGGLRTFDPNTGAILAGYNDGWGIRSSIASITNDLQNTNRAITIGMSISQSSQSELSVHIEGQAGFTVGSWLQFSTQAGGSYDMSKAQGSSTDAKVSISYVGYSLVPTAPASWQQAIASGFYFPDPIRQAAANAGQDVTGYQFLNTPPYDLGPVDAGGDFGLLTNLLISNYPTVTITYSNANYSSFAQSWEEHVSGNLKLFGLINLGSFSQGSQSSSLTKGADNSTFTVTFSASPEVVGVPQNLKTAYVIGAAVANPGSAG